MVDYTNVTVRGKRLPRTIKVKPPDSRMDTSKITSPKRNQDASFACMKELAPMLSDVSEKDVWEYLKNAYGGVESRTEFTEMDWAQISARLNAAKRDNKLRANLNDAVRKFKDETPKQGVPPQ